MQSAPVQWLTPGLGERLPAEPRKPGDIRMSHFPRTNRAPGQAPPEARRIPPGPGLMNDTAQLMCQPLRPLGQTAEVLFTVL